MLVEKIPEEEELSNFNIKMYKTLGTMVGTTLKKQLKVKKINSISIFQILKKILKNMNLDTELKEQSLYKVEFIIRNCPIYKNAIKAGFGMTLIFK
ncbi:MAG: hypothetical protein ACFFAO_03700 [Candidatus Hermodarchaeota archaeon]